MTVARQGIRCWPPPVTINPASQAWLLAQAVKTVGPTKKARVARPRLQDALHLSSSIRAAFQHSSGAAPLGPTPSAPANARHYLHGMFQGHGYIARRGFFVSRNLTSVWGIAAWGGFIVVGASSSGASSFKCLEFAMTRTSLTAGDYPLAGSPLSARRGLPMEGEELHDDGAREFKVSPVCATAKGVGGRFSVGARPHFKSSVRANTCQLIPNPSWGLWSPLKPRWGSHQRCSRSGANFHIGRLGRT